MGLSRWYSRRWASVKAQKQHSPLTSGLCSGVANRYLAGFTLMFATIGHQIFNRDYRHIVLLSELDALRRAGHGAIVIRQLAQHACRFKASRSRGR